MNLADRILIKLGRGFAFFVLSCFLLPIPMMGFVAIATEALWKSQCFGSHVIFDDVMLDAVVVYFLPVVAAFTLVFSLFIDPESDGSDGSPP